MQNQWQSHSPGFVLRGICWVYRVRVKFRFILQKALTSVKLTNCWTATVVESLLRNATPHQQHCCALHGPR